MKIIISPARTMQVDTDSLPYKNLPKFIHQTEDILAWMRSLSYDELHKVWGNCSSARLAKREGAVRLLGYNSAYVDRKSVV